MIPVTRDDAMTAFKNINNMQRQGVKSLWDTGSLTQII